MDTINIHYREKAREEEQQCYQATLGYLNKHWSYRLLTVFVWCCWGLATVAFISTVTLFSLILLFSMSGLDLFLAGAVGAMVVFGVLGLALVNKRHTKGLQLAGELLREHTKPPMTSYFYQQRKLPLLKPLQQTKDNKRMVADTSSNAVARSIN